MINKANFLLDISMKHVDNLQKDLSTWVAFKPDYDDYDLEPYIDDEGFKTMPRRHISYISSGVKLTTKGFQVWTWFRKKDKAYRYRIIGLFRIHRHRTRIDVDMTGEIICEDSKEYFSELCAILASVVESEV